ncbi:MAG: IclR family transcriptional regulator [Chloroflexota bacterium]
MSNAPRIKQNTASPTSKTTVQSVERTLDILEALADRGEAGIAQLSQQVGLHASTVHRLLSTLIARGYVRQNHETGRYLLGLKALDVARAVRDQLDLRMEALPILRELMQKSGETANLAILDGQEVVYLEQVSSPGWMLRMFVQVGARAPLHSTASGKVLLAYLPELELNKILSNYLLTPFAGRTIVEKGVLLSELEEVRRVGYATDYGEQEEGVSCVAGPVRDFTGRVVAAISVSGPWIRITPERVSVLVPLISESCARLSIALGYKDTEAGIRGYLETGQGEETDSVLSSWRKG